MVQSVKSVKKKAAKKQPANANASVAPENPWAELAKAIESGCLGPVMTVQRVPKGQISEDVFAQSFGRIAEKLVRTDERIDKLSAAVENLLNRFGVVSAEVPMVRNDNCFTQHSGDRRHLDVAVAAPSGPRHMTIEDSMKMLADVAARISDYVEEHKRQYAGVTNQATKSDVHIDQVPPATCELQSSIHCIVHSLLIANAELREMLSRSLV
jgi:hypothetical protein